MLLKLDKPLLLIISFIAKSINCSIFINYLCMLYLYFKLKDLFITYEKKNYVKFIKSK